jgi:hypothetical protein
MVASNAMLVRASLPVPLVFGLFGMIACSEDAATGQGPSDAGSVDSGSDAASPGKDAGKDAGAPGLPAGSACSFNDDCSPELRCEEKTLTCQPGVRGTGKNGIDACTTGDTCESALCVEGPTNGSFVCSGHCFDDKDCGNQLPRCLNVPQIGTFCARAATP